MRDLFPPPADLVPLPPPFRALGKVIEAVGTPDFVSQLAIMLNDLLPLNVVHIERSRADHRLPTGFRCEWLGSSGLGMDTTLISDVMTLYYDRFCDVDPLFAGLRGQSGTILVVRDIAAMPTDEFRLRLFDEASIAHECVLARGTRHVQHSIALERVLHAPPFTLAELSRFRGVSDVLFPLLELHASRRAARRVAPPASLDHPLTRFDERLAADRCCLSRREYEICAHLLTGRTVPEAAQIIGVRVGTAESYVKRAFLKLGVRTKRDLIAWGRMGPDFTTP